MNQLAHIRVGTIIRQTGIVYAECLSIVALHASNLLYAQLTERVQRHLLFSIFWFGIPLVRPSFCSLDNLVDCGKSESITRKAFVSHVIKPYRLNLIFSVHKIRVRHLTDY